MSVISLGPLGSPFVPIICVMTETSRIDNSLGPTYIRVSLQMGVQLTELLTYPYDIAVPVMERLYV